MNRQELLKRAEELGLSFPKNIKTERLEEIVTEAERDLKEGITGIPAEEPHVDESITITPEELERLKQEAIQEALKQEKEKFENRKKNLENDEVPTPVLEGKKKLDLRKKALALKRVIITPRDPMKQDWPGEIISAGNDVIGEVKKYVPFNVETGWHIPQIIYNVMKEKKCTIFVKKRVNGQMVNEAKLVSAYSITDLPPLTKDELEELAREQAARG